MNLALIAIKFRGELQDAQFRVPVVVPVLGSISCIALADFWETPMFIIVGGALAIGVLSSLWHHTDRQNLNKITRLDANLTRFKCEVS